MIVTYYRVKTSHRWLMGKSKDWLAREVFFLMKELGEAHVMRTHEPLRDLYSKDQLARLYSHLAARLPDDPDA